MAKLRARLQITAQNVWAATVEERSRQRMIVVSPERSTETAIVVSDMHLCCSTSPRQFAAADVQLARALERVVGDSMLFVAGDTFELLGTTSGIPDDEDGDSDPAAMANTANRAPAMDNAADRTPARVMWSTPIWARMRWPGEMRMATNGAESDGRAPDCDCGCTGKTARPSTAAHRRRLLAAAQGPTVLSSACAGQCAACCDPWDALLRPISLTWPETTRVLYGSKAVVVCGNHDLALAAHGLAVGAFTWRGVHIAHGHLDDAMLANTFLGTVVPYAHCCAGVTVASIVSTVVHTTVAGSHVRNGAVARLELRGGRAGVVVVVRGHTHRPRIEIVRRRDICCCSNQPTCHCLHRCSDVAGVYVNTGACAGFARSIAAAQATPPTIDAVRITVHCDVEYSVCRGTIDIASGKYIVLEEVRLEKSGTGWTAEQSPRLSASQHSKIVIDRQNPLLI